MAGVYHALDIRLREPVFRELFFGIRIGERDEFVYLPIVGFGRLFQHGIGFVKQIEEGFVQQIEFGRGILDQRF